MTNDIRAWTRTVLLFSGLAIGATGQGFGQFPSAPRELGMGGAYMGVARGYEAVFLAPANLGLADAPAWSVGLPQAAFGGTLIGPGFGDMRDIFALNELSAGRRDELVGMIPAAGTEGSFTLRAPLIAVSSGGWGFGVTYTSMGRHTLSRDVSELLLQGYEDGRSFYAVGDTHGEFATFWDLAVGYGTQIEGLSVGVTAHFLRGGEVSRSKLFDPRIDVNAGEIEVDYVGVNARGGAGYSFDFGVAYQPVPALTISGALSNILWSINWPDELHSRILTLDRQSLADADPMQLRKRYRGSDTPIDPGALTYEVAETVEGLSDRVIAPTVVRLGLAWDATPGTQLALDFHRRSAVSERPDPWDQRIAIGLQQSVSIFAVRAGYALGNEGGRLMSGGLSVGPVDVGVAKYQHAVSAGHTSEGWIASFGIGIKSPQVEHTPTYIMPRAR